MKPIIGNIFKHDFSFTDEQALAYAQLSGDTNPVHVIKSYGVQSMFGRCIVHGFSVSVFFQKCTEYYCTPMGICLLANGQNTSNLFLP
ncbi:MaoC/PaaZ C-terminal domain-containing protein [Niabella drilacis]|uniref:MaoC like domain-containing protein n=1 Tax=Niabella drilacis (strain DSM 25811 / CCM 8410 / CCUG 62505 / LMG 26954 / E90) TaxID=1285928 RepID=A0A1G7BW65_NIADE|nr:MaoC/PaaZ C-terminal domain-containing protein [Niabella drilacis]SDE31358.1 MaoC like domain-containing protein [Niabella drilacis]